MHAPIREEETARVVAGHSGGYSELPEDPEDSLMIGNRALLAVALASPLHASSQEQWTTLPLPKVSQPGAITLSQFPQAECRPITLETDSPTSRIQWPTLLPADHLVQLLESRAREHGESLTLLPRTPPLLAKGSPQALESARSTLAQIDAASGSLQSRVHVLWREGNPAGPSETVRLIDLGAPVTIGSLTAHPFLATYDVDVTTDSAAANPDVGTFKSGRQLTLEAHRVLDHDHYFVRGHLLWSELESLSEFDLGSPDLGVLEQPSVVSVELAFSALLRAGEPLSVVMSGLPLKTPDATLEVSLTPASANGESEFEVHDLRFLNSASPTLPAVELDRVTRFLGAGIEPRFQSVATRALTNIEGRPSPSLFVTSQCVIAPKSSETTAPPFVALKRGYETGRLASGRLRVETGSMSIELPSTAFAPSRVCVGRFATRVIDYATAIAPETWIAVPIVDTLFDGVVIDAEQVGVELRVTAIETRSGEVRTRTRFDAVAGNLQLVERSQREGMASARAGEETLPLWPDSAFGPALRTFFFAE